MNSSDCWCSNNYGKYGASKKCNMACTGNPNEICGGKMANSVYDGKKFKIKNY